LLKIILAYCGYSPTSSFFLLLSEHKFCDNVVTRSNSNAGGKFFLFWVVGRGGSVSTWTKEDESSTGRIWAAGFYLITARSRLARILKLMKCLFL